MPPGRKAHDKNRKTVYTPNVTGIKKTAAFAALLLLGGCEAEPQVSGKDPTYDMPAPRSPRPRSSDPATGCQGDSCRPSSGGAAPSDGRSSSDQEFQAQLRGPRPAPPAAAAGRYADEVAGAAGGGSEHGSLEELTSANYEEKVARSKIPVFVKYYGTNCDGCKFVAPAIDDLAKEYSGRIAFYQANLQDTARRPPFPKEIFILPGFGYYENGSLIAVRAQNPVRLEDVTDLQGWRAKIKSWFRRALANKNFN